MSTPAHYLDAAELERIIGAVRGWLKYLDKGGWTPPPDPASVMWRMIADLTNAAEELAWLRTQQTPSDAL